MCKVQMLRALLNQRLSAAVEEILVAVETTIAEYEEELCRSKEEIERQRQLLDAVFKSPLEVGLHQAGVSPEHRQHEPESHSVKEEEEEEKQEHFPSFAPEQQREAELLRVKEEKKEEEEEEEVQVREQLEPLIELPGQRKQGTKRKATSPRDTFGQVVEVVNIFGDEELPSSLWEDGAEPPVAVELADDSSSSTCGEGEKKKSSTFAWTRTDKEVLAAFFEKYPMFYDSCLDEFKDPSIKRAVVKQFVKEQFEHKGRPAPTYKQVMGFLKNYRTRFVKLNSKKSTQEDEQLTATEQWILDNFAYLRPHIKKRRGRRTHQASSKTRSHARPAPIASDSDVDDPVPSTSAVCGRRRAQAGSRPSGRAGRDVAAVPGDADELLSQLLSRADQAAQRRIGHTAALPSHEAEVKRFTQYLKALMMNIPEGQT